MSFRKIYLLAIPAIIAIIILIFMISNTSLINKKKFDLQIDATKEEQSLFTHTRVKITNNGIQPLTNITINYGNKSETISILQPGQSYPLSPPPGSDLEKLRVTTDEGINITQEYRTPIKMPGMMGS
jgi:archaellum component FlaF (FlaF/FlaG flagellin family)